MRCFPPEFRELYEDELLDAVRRTGAEPRAGRLARTWPRIAIAADLLGAALRLRLRPP
jgi:hypothetical protein